MRNCWKRFKDDDREEGFTLIELMVVVLIIAILIAIAIPTFLGAREKAQDRAAQSNARNALTSVVLFYTVDNSYAGMDVAALERIEPSLQWTDTLNPTGKEVGVKLSAGSEAACITSTSGSGATFTIIDVKTPFGSAGAGTYFSDTAPAACDDAATTGLSQDGF
jgi:type IV pilus assembly protein PilA